jgi:hypothetical protein
VPTDVLRSRSAAAPTQAPSLEKRFADLRAMWRGCCPLLVLPAAVLTAAPAWWPRWAWMWTLALAVFAGCKWLTWRRARASYAPAWKHLAYLALWPGMDADSFLSSGPVADGRPRGGDWLFAMVKLACGALLLVWSTGLAEAGAVWLAGWLGMAGIVLLLHFGAFDMLSLAWRAGGVNARPLMNWPLAASSLSDFWGRRWNTAFRDLAHAFVFRPATRAVGTTAALAIAFLASGLVHDLVISVPAGGGYGGPTIYFAAQAGGVLVERSAAGRQIGIGHGWKGWLFTMLVLVVPLPLLVHAPFINEVAVPMLRAWEVAR